MLADDGRDRAKPVDGERLMTVVIPLFASHSEKRSHLYDQISALKIDWAMPKTWLVIEDASLT